MCMPLLSILRGNRRRQRPVSGNILQRSLGHFDPSCRSRRGSSRDIRRLNSTADSSAVVALNEAYESPVRAVSKTRGPRSSRGSRSVRHDAGSRAARANCAVSGRPIYINVNRTRVTGNWRMSRRIVTESPGKD